MRKHANFVRLIWAMLLLVLVQAWSAATHVHAMPEARDAAVRPEAVAAATIPETDEAPDAGTTDCHCLWCSPRLHLFVSIAFVAQLLCAVLRLLSRVRVDAPVPTWRTRFLSPPALRGPPSLFRAAA
ncbi:hypothetical protein [Cupriavidus oxalaticus]|uniref:hypothetical protein n=1 Tax=Cupriavidus oxalaticus TaxID=96344 RepID=UPI00317BD719